MSDDNITVKLSGTAIFKAVKNYLKDNQDLDSFKATVNDAVAKVIVNRYSSPEAFVRHLQSALRGWHWDVLLKDVIKKGVELEVAALVKEELGKLKVVDHVTQAVRAQLRGL